MAREFRQGQPPFLANRTVLCHIYASLPANMATGAVDPVPVEGFERG